MRPLLLRELLRDELREPLLRELLRELLRDPLLREPPLLEPPPREPRWASSCSSAVTSGAARVLFTAARPAAGCRASSTPSTVPIRRVVVRRLLMGWLLVGWLLGCRVLVVMA